MRRSRKCADCNTWTDNSDYCSKCGKLINSVKSVGIEMDNKEKEAKEASKTAFDKWLENLSTTSNPFVKLFYYLVYSVWVVFSAIITFILFLVSAASG